MKVHIPVLLKEVLEIFNPKPNQHAIDCTVGEGGHATAILERTSPSGRLLGIDRDIQILNLAKNNLAGFGSRVVLVKGRFANLSKIIQQTNFPAPSMILFDLGLSWWHLEQSGRGFSFLRDEPLDMRFDPQETKIDASFIINNWSAKELEAIFKRFGQEKYSRRIAKAVVKERARKAIENTQDLVKIIDREKRKIARREKIHPATRIFQALRITVNQELEELKVALPQAFQALSSGGKIIVISFHSLEDGIVKQFSGKFSDIKILTKKPIQPSPQEIHLNPRARSAKLRAFQRL